MQRHQGNGPMVKVGVRTLEDTKHCHSQEMKHAPQNKKGICCSSLTWWGSTSSLQKALSCNEGIKNPGFIKFPPKPNGLLPDPCLCQMVCWGKPCFRHSDDLLFLQVWVWNFSLCCLKSKPLFLAAQRWVLWSALLWSALIALGRCWLCFAWALCVLTVSVSLCGGGGPVSDLASH